MSNDERDPLTHHGRPLGDTTQDKRPPLKRSQSVRRMSRSVLEDVAGKSTGPAQQLATRELQVRGEMERISQLQTSSHPTQIAATRPISRVGVDALRYSQSLAEEAYDKANAAQKFPVFGRETTPEVIGVSENRGRVGVGFSGDKEAHPLGGALLAQGMLDIQKQYAGRTSTWSGKLEPVLLQSTIGESKLSEKRTICAATRSTAATFPELGQKQAEVPREVFSGREGLLEAQSQSFTGKKVKPHRSIMGHVAALKALEEPDPAPMLKRSHSLQNLMESCDVCKREFAAISEKRDKK
jgi:hypothetical protein